jgi:hypothetical protein
MNKYKLGDIFTDDEFYTDRAIFCNENGYYIDEIEPLKNGTRQFKICAPKKKSLDELKAEKLSELTNICHNFDDRLVNNDMYVISSLGFKVNADIRSQNNLKGLIAVNADTVNFVDYNNEIHKLKASDLNTLLVECSKNGENLYLQKWAYTEKIKTCKNIAELEKIDFNFVMLDFSKE